MLFIPIKTEIKFINKYNVSIKIIIIIEDIKFLKKKIKVVKREIKIFFLSEIITEIYNIPKNLITEDVIIKNNDHMFITNKTIRSFIKYPVLISLHKILSKK